MGRAIELWTTSHRVHERVESAATDLLKNVELITDMHESIIPFETIVSGDFEVRPLIFTSCTGKRISGKIVRNKTDKHCDRE